MSDYMYKVILTYLQENISIEKNYIASNIILEHIPSPTEEELIENLKDADGIISAYEPITREVIKNLPNLKIISQAAMGFNNIDLDAARERKIAVTNVKDYCTDEVADHTLALILSLSRKILEFNNLVQKNKIWSYEKILDIRNSSNLTLGLFGFGKIGRAVATRAAALGFKIIVFDPYISEKIIDDSIIIVDLKKFLLESDIVSIHAPLTKETKNFFDLNIFKKLERTPYIINVARGGIINEKDLVKALELKLIRGAGLDVLASENPNLEDSKLLGRENVILTPHVAYYSKESQEKVRKKSVENINFFFNNQKDKLDIVY